MTHEPELAQTDDVARRTPDSSARIDAATPTQPGTTGRRTLLAGAGLSITGLAVLAACGGKSGSDAGGGSGSDSGSGSTGSGSASAAGFSVAASSVPVGGGFIDTKAKVVVTQPTAGTYKGFSAVCTHRGCTVGKVADGVISCPCHGSEFSATDGSVKQGPASKPLSSVSVKKSGTTIVPG